MLSITGCVTLADPEASQNYTSDAVGVLNAQTSLGQSFVSRRPNLNGITLWLTLPSGQSNTTPTGFPNNIYVKLFLDPGVSMPVYSTEIQAPASGDDIPITISIPNQKNPSGQNYYLLLIGDSGTIQINGRNEDAYPLGQTYINGKTINADIAFRLNYDYDLSALMQDSKLFIASSWIILPLILLLWLPGWLLLDLSGFRPHFNFGEQIAISTGISLALIPVVMLWTTILKIKWSRESVFFVAGFLIALLIIRIIFVYITSKRVKPKLDSSQSSDQPIPNTKRIKFGTVKSISLILIFLVSLAIRLIMVRDLATPAWVDSVHHALITRMILNDGAYPSTYLPYLDIPSTVYHPGFHSIAAAFIWLTNLDLPQSLLILGQVLNALCVFSVYLLATTLTRSSTAGLFAAFITGFLTPMPAYYTSWGRYTELTGLLILPVVLALIQLRLDENSKVRNIWILLLGAIAAGGLFMIHYRVIVFLASLIFSFVIFQLIFRTKASKINPVRFLLFVLAMAVFSILSVLPWFIQTIKTTVLPSLNLPVAVSIPFFQDFSWPYLTSALGKQSMVIAALGLLWSLIKRRSLAMILCVWVLLLFFLANLGAFSLPGGGLITNTSVEIVLFIPISILGGYFIDQVLIHWQAIIPKQLIVSSLVLICLLLGIVAYLGARQLIPIINPVTILSRNADLPAIEWINEHIPQNETIVINPFAWGYGLFAGNDGGYWISPLSGRLILPPPVIYGLGSGAKEINQKAQEVILQSANPIAFMKFLTSHQLHYVYVGARGGVIPAEKLASSGLFNVLYHQDGVWIFSVKP